mmetsp:Transcript_35863/g.93149  ORF Transcript_35863/g.93149 Transcript_35863/m.93149 type:complete len:256 (+) Transcript_35863:152-919(+)
MRRYSAGMPSIQCVRTSSLAMMSWKPRRMGPASSMPATATPAGGSSTSVTPSSPSAAGHAAGPMSTVSPSTVNRSWRLDDRMLSISGDMRSPTLARTTASSDKSNPARRASSKMYIVLYRRSTTRPSTSTHMCAIACVPPPSALLSAKPDLASTPGTPASARLAASPIAPIAVACCSRASHITRATEAAFRKTSASSGESAAASSAASLPAGLAGSSGGSNDAPPPAPTAKSARNFRPGRPTFRGAIAMAPPCCG